MERIVELTKDILNNKGDIEELKKELYKELTPTGKLSRIHGLMKDNELNEDNYEFMLKLISNNEELYNQINRLKYLKDLKQKQKDLETLKGNLVNTKNELERQINGLENTTTPKSNIPIIKTIQKKKLERKNKDILKTKFEQIIKTIEQSKLNSENKNLKEEYTSNQDLKQTLDAIYKNCEIENIDEIKRLGLEINDKYESIITTINLNMNKYSREYRTARLEIEKYDSRLREYTYNRKNNYITLSIETLSKRNLINYNTETNQYEINEPKEKDNYELIAYSLVALYLINVRENSKIKMAFIKRPIEEKKAISQTPIINNIKEKIKVYNKKIKR